MFHKGFQLLEMEDTILLAWFNPQRHTSEKCPLSIEPRSRKWIRGSL